MLYGDIFALPGGPFGFDALLSYILIARMKIYSTIAAFRVLLERIAADVCELEKMKKFTKAFVLLIVAGDVVPVNGGRDLVVLRPRLVHQQVAQKGRPAG
jgi:hypothetical protein